MGSPPAPQQQVGPGLWGSDHLQLPGRGAELVGGAWPRRGRDLQGGSEATWPRRCERLPHVELKSGFATCFPLVEELICTRACGMFQTLVNQCVR